MGAYGLDWTVAIPPDGWCRWTAGWAVIGRNADGAEVVFQPDHLGRVWGYAGSRGARGLDPQLGATIQAVVRSARHEDLPQPFSRYGWKGSALRRRLCQCIADRLTAIGARAGVAVADAPTAAEARAA